jgi:hypothetical protein
VELLIAEDDDYVREARGQIRLSEDERRGRPRHRKVALERGCQEIELWPWSRCTASE